MGVGDGNGIVVIVNLLIFSMFFVLTALFGCTSDAEFCGDRFRARSAVRRLPGHYSRAHRNGESVSTRGRGRISSLKNV